MAPGEKPPFGAFLFSVPKKVFDEVWLFLKIAAVRKKEWSKAFFA